MLVRAILHESDQFVVEGLEALGQIGGSCAHNLLLPQGEWR
jgi:hypothetical protein